MTTCDRILDRLYDEDCRRALLGHALLAADVAAHVASCRECRSRCEELRNDALTLTAALSEDLPEAPRAAMRVMLAEAYPPTATLLDWRATLVWAVAGGAVAACGIVVVAPQLSAIWQATLIAAAVSLGAATEVTRQGLEA